MYKHVLIPAQLDDSRDIDAAAKAAQVLSVKGGRVTFLHVIEPLPAPVVAYWPDGYPMEARETLRKKLDEVAGLIDGAHAALVDGTAGRTITTWAEENGVDCIVIPSHQPTFSDLFLGSTAAWVVRHADCAVHVVR